MLVVAAAYVPIAAVAAIPAPTKTFTGPSATSLYALYIVTGCTHVGCTKATRVVVEVTTPAASPASTCPSGSYTFPSLKLKHGKFSATHAFAGGPTLTVSGKFPTRTSLQGRVTGTMSCGTDTYTLQASVPTSG